MAGILFVIENPDLLKSPVFNENQSDTAFFLNKPLILLVFESAKSSMHGTSTRVRKVAKLSPNIIVHDKGPQNATLSPPKYR